jgi:hypothetical protein
MSNLRTLKAVAIISFCISGMFTILLMTSGTVGIMGWVLTIGMAVVLELAKCGMFFESISNENLKPALRMAIGAIAVVLIGCSIFASSAYVINQSNAKKNSDIKTSDEYQMELESRNYKKDLYDSNKNDIVELRKQQETIRTDGATAVNSMPRNYIDKRNSQRIDTQNKVDDLQKSIDEKMAQQTKITELLADTLDVNAIKVNSENGYTSMFAYIANLVNDKGDKNPLTPQTLELWFFIFLGFIFELVAVFTAYLYQVKSGKAINLIKKKTDAETEQQKPFVPHIVKNGTDNSTHFEQVEMKLAEGMG